MPISSRAPLLSDAIMAKHNVPSTSPDTLTSLFHYVNNSNKNYYPLGIPFYELMRRVHWYLFRDCQHTFLIYGSVLRDRQFPPLDKQDISIETIPDALFNSEQMSDIDIRTAEPNKIVHELRYIINEYCNVCENVIYILDTLNAIHVATTRIRVFNQVIIDVTYMDENTMLRLLKHSTRIEGCNTNAYMGPNVQTIHDVFKHISRPDIPVLGNPLLPQHKTVKWQKSIKLVVRMISAVMSGDENGTTANGNLIVPLNQQSGIIQIANSENGGSNRQLVLRRNIVYSGPIAIALLVWTMRKCGITMSSKYDDTFGIVSASHEDNIMLWMAPHDITSIGAIASAFMYYSKEYPISIPTALRTVYNLWLPNFYYNQDERLVIYDYMQPESFETYEILQYNIIFMLPSFVIVEIGSWMLANIGPMEEHKEITFTLLRLYNLEQHSTDVLNNEQSPVIKHMALPGYDTMISVTRQGKLTNSNERSKTYLMREYNATINQLQIKDMDEDNHYNIYTTEMQNKFWSILEMSHEQLAYFAKRIAGRIGEQLIIK